MPMTSTDANNGSRGEEGMRKPFWSTKRSPVSGVNLMGILGSFHTGGEPEDNLVNSDVSEKEIGDKPGTMMVGEVASIQLYDPMYRTF